MRLASCSGLLLGIEDRRTGERGEKEQGIDVDNARTEVENETVVALAEVMDTYDMLQEQCRLGSRSGKMNFNLLARVRSFKIIIILG